MGLQLANWLGTLFNSSSSGAPTTTSDASSSSDRQRQQRPPVVLLSDYKNAIIASAPAQALTWWGISVMAQDMAARLATLALAIAGRCDDPNQLIKMPSHRQTPGRRCWTDVQKGGAPSPVAKTPSNKGSPSPLSAPFPSGLRRLLEEEICLSLRRWGVG